MSKKTHKPPANPTKSMEKAADPEYLGVSHPHNKNKKRLKRVQRELNPDQNGPAADES